MSLKTERTVSYPKSMVGERVGWIATGKIASDEDTLLSIDVVTATVGLEGAWQGFRYSESSQFNMPVQEGFLAVSAMSSIIRPGKPTGDVDEQNLRFVFPQTDHEIDRSKVGLLAQGAGGLTDRLTDYKRTEAASKDEIIEILKERLDQTGFGDRYPQLYYWLNGAPQLKDGAPIEGVAIPQMLLPDPAMRTQTTDQAVLAESITSSLQNLHDRNEIMRRRMTVFSDIPSSEVATRFIDNRTFAHSAELLIREKMSKLAVRRLVYLPIGVQRTWPYMDAGVEGVEGYGPELDGLRARKIHPAYDALADESRELERRELHARSAAQRFKLLLSLEKARQSN